MVYGPFPDLAALASAISDDLCLGAEAAVQGNPRVVARVVEECMQENFRIEDEINREAERSLADLGSAAGGMDKHKLLAGLRERIAKKRRFVL